MSINTMTFAARHFWRRRGASDEHTRPGSVRSEQRSLRQKGLPPKGLRCFWPGASLLVGYSPTAGDAPSSRLAPGQKQRNERHRIYAHQYLGQLLSVEIQASAASLQLLAKMEESSHKN